MCLLEFPPMGKNGSSSNEIRTDIQISLSPPVSTKATIVGKNSSANTPVPTQGKNKSGANKNMAAFDHRLPLFGNATEMLPFTESIYC